MLGDLHENAVLAECSHCDVDQFLVPIFVDDGDHFFGNLWFQSEAEGGVAVGIVEDHFVDVNRYALHPLYYVLFFMVLA